MTKKLNFFGSALLFGLVMVASNVKSQSLYLKGGINHGKMVNQRPHFPFRSGNTFGGGIGIDKPIKTLNNWTTSVSLEVLYQDIQSVKRIKGNIYYKEGFQLIQVPILFKSAYQINTLLDVYANVGPSFAKGISYTFDLDKNHFNQKWHKNLIPIDIALNVGGGIGMKLGTGKLLIDYRYTASLTHLQENEWEIGIKANTPYVTKGKYSSRVHSFTLGYSLPLSKI